MKRIYQRLNIKALSFAGIGRFILAGAMILIISSSVSGQELILTSFTVKSLGEKKVILSWNTSTEKNSSHFTIEKSLNGKDFSDAGIHFSIGDSAQPQQYNFTDVLRPGEKGMIYYRLKMVDTNKKCKHSETKAIRIGDEKGLDSQL